MRRRHCSRSEAELRAKTTASPRSLDNVTRVRESGNLRERWESIARECGRAIERKDIGLTCTVYIAYNKCVKRNQCLMYINARKVTLPINS